MIRVMPILKSAIKKQKQDKKRTAVNTPYKLQYRAAVKKMREEKTKKALQAAFQALDKAAQKRVIHKNKAARLKSRLNKLAR